MRLVSGINCWSAFVCGSLQHRIPTPHLETESELILRFGICDISQSHSVLDLSMIRTKLTYAFRHGLRHRPNNTCVQVDRLGRLRTTDKLRFVCILMIDSSLRLSNPDLYVTLFGIQICICTCIPCKIPFRRRT